MDFAPIIDQVTGVLWYLIPIALIAALVKSPWFKGVAGEFLVNLAARLFLDKNKYHLIKNVTLPTEEGSTQIDHVIVSEFGVFVVETKNMKGWISGSAGQKTWTQKIYKHTSKFQNPLHQNYKHVKTLQSLLGLDDQQLHSLVVFVGDSTFKTDMPNNVTYCGGYIRYVKSKQEPVLAETRVKEIVQKIEQGRLVPSFMTNRDHVRHVKKIVADKAQKTEPSCPKCGGSMIIRGAKRGQNAGKKFWGCLSFPQCRGIVSAS